jgi:Domain of unknown function (DUF4259)
MTQFVLVGAWDAGPFDNDDAADFAQGLDNADPNMRLILLRQALTAALDAEDTDDLEEAQPHAVAAAAVLAANRLAEAPPDSAYAPKFLATEEPFEVPDDLVELAVLAVDRVAASDTEWAELFGEAGTLEALRDALTG